MLSASSLRRAGLKWKTPSLRSRSRVSTRSFVDASKPPSETRVVVALSGGVDSAVAAYLLKKQGYQVSGIYMRNWSEADEQYCSGIDDLESVDKVAHFLDIPYKVVDFQKEYWNHVFEPVLDAYQAGITPNPDVLCNREIKFKALSDFVFSRDPKPDFLATGHYAQIRKLPLSASQSESQSSISSNTSSSETPVVKRRSRSSRKTSDSQTLESNPITEETSFSVELVEAADHNKDQTYFLLQVPQEALKNVIFPIGHLTKPQVREIAIQANLPNAQRKESMGLCFVGKRKFDEFIGEFTERPGSKPGAIISLETGQTVGVHKGALFYTVGQSAKISGAPERFFVVDKDLDKNTITVVPGSHHPALYKETLTAHRVNWISGEPPAALLKNGGPFKCFARIRHRQELQPCTVSLLPKTPRSRTSSDSASTEFDPNAVHVTFDHPLRAVSEGQFVGFYVNNVCLGGGAISSSGKSYHELRKPVPLEERSSANVLLSRSSEAVESL